MHPRNEARSRSAADVVRNDIMVRESTTPQRPEDDKYFDVPCTD